MTPEMTFSICWECSTRYFNFFRERFFAAKKKTRLWRALDAWAKEVNRSKVLDCSSICAQQVEILIGNIIIFGICIHVNKID